MELALDRMKTRYNEKTDTAYIYLRDAEEPYPDVGESEEVAPGVIVDFDRAERPVGIEIHHSGIIARQPKA